MAALLEVRAISLTFWRGVHATKIFQDVSFDLEAGELGGIWGRRGSGKTTLALVAAGVQPTDAGSVLLDGRELRDPDRDRDLLAQIGFASRRGPELEDMDAVTWISSTLVHLCSWRDARHRARTALDRVGLSDAATLVWGHMSDGERMLAAIAQAIVRGPRLLVVDDPVGGLGGRDRAEIMALLRGFADEGVAVLVTAAELRELHGLDQIWSLDRGRLDGPPRRAGAEIVPLRASR